MAIDPETLRKLVAGVKLKDGVPRPEPPKVNPVVAALVAQANFTMKNELTQERLKELLHYNPDTGVFTWTKAGRRVKIGDVAGYVHKGYVVLRIDSRSYQAQNLVWLYMHGKFPDRELDHIDRNGTNNRSDNLIETDPSTQQFNKGVYKNNTSGHKGVYRHTDRCRWRAEIGGTARVRLGSFDTFEEAVAARQAAEIKLLGCTTEELSDPRNRRPKFKRRM